MMSERVLGGRYAVQDKVGTGGMAVVYRGLDQVLGRTVAIKTMLPQYATDSSFAARFKQEAQAAAALQSPYIVSVYDWGKDSDTYYIVMEYLRGTDLKSGIRRHGALDCKKVAQIGSQIAQALSVAHQHDIIHRDIKPQNIMVLPDGNIKVMDFGIARAKNSHLTQDNSVLGTAHYVSPEQTQGKELGPTTDIYSLGIVMYEAATGSVPFDGDDAISVALKQVNEQPEPPSQRNPRVDATLESIILKCMQKNPADRFQSADELAHVLRDYLAGRLRAVNNMIASMPTSTVTAPIPVTPGGATNTLPVTNTGNTASIPRVESANHARQRPQRATDQAYEQRHTGKKKKKGHKALFGVIVALLVIGIAAFAAFSYLGSSSETEAVPNLVGLSQEDALKQIQADDFFQQGSVKEEYSSSVAKGLVIDQDPDAGQQKAKGTQINLVVSKGEEPAVQVQVPDLTGMSPSEAEAALQRVGLVSQAGDSVYSDTVEVGKVAGQNPAAGTTVKAGDTITYQLSKGQETVEIPNVVGKSEADATSALKAAGFAVKSTKDESDTVNEGLVIKQSATGSAAKGSTVTITVSSGTTKATIPSVIGQSESAATGALQNAGFDVAVNYEQSSTVSKGVVIGQSSKGSAKKGATVTITVSTGAPSTNTNNNSSSSDNSKNTSNNSNGGTTNNGTTTD